MISLLFAHGPVKRRHARRGRWCADGPPYRWPHHVRQVLVGLVVCCTPGQVAAQQQPDTVTISGTVRDATSGQPISFATISVDGAAMVLAESDGTFAIPRVLPGTRTLQIERIGYATRRLVLTVQAGMPLHVSVTLDALAAELAPVDVQAVQPFRRDLTGFLERRERGFGHHVTRSEFERWNPTTAIDVLRRMPGVRVRPNPESAWFVGDIRLSDHRRYIVETSRGGEISYSSRVVPECPVVYFVDGLMVGNARDYDIESSLSIYQVEAIESYVGAQVPVAFQHPEARCGVIAFWTGPDATRSGGPDRSMWFGVAGAAAGAIFGLAAPSNCSTCLFDTTRLNRTMGNAMVLGILGVVIGGFVHGSGTSQSSVARGVGITVLAGGDGSVGLGATISFGPSPLRHRSLQQHPR